LQKTLAQAIQGQKVVVIGFTDQLLSLKFLEMGLLPGTEVTIKHLAPLGDPIALDLNNYLLALRKDEAETVIVI
jgi:ferrous iron transport protein A